MLVFFFEDNAHYDNDNFNSIITFNKLKFKQL